MQSKLGSLASDTMVYGITTAVGRFLTFMLTPLYTNYLTKSEIGEVTGLFALIGFVNILYSLGLEPAFMRFWHKDNESNNRDVYVTAFTGVGVMSVIVTLITVLCASFIASSPLLQLENNGTSLVQLAALIPFFDALVLIPYARLRMLRKPKQFVMIRFLVIVINVSLNFIFVVWLGQTIEGVVLAGVLSSACAFLVFLPSIRKQIVDFDRAKQRTTRLKEMLRFGLPTVPSSFSSIMVQLADRPLLLMLTSSATLGLYQTNFRLAIPLMMFVTVFEYAWKPFFLNHRDDDDAKQLFARVLTLFTVVCGMVFLITALFMPYLVQVPFIGGRFINPAYWSGLSIVPIAMFAYFFNGVFINMAAGLHITKKTWWLPIATGTAAVLNVAATIGLVPLLGIDGAAWAKVIAYVGGAVVLYVYVQRVYPMQYDFLRIGGVVALAGCIYAGIQLLPDGTMMQFLVSVAALVVYVALLAVFNIIPKGWMHTLRQVVRR